MTTSAPASTGSPRLFTAQFLLVLVTGAVYFLGIGGVLSQLAPFIVDELGATEAMAGAVMGSMAVTALVARPWFGRTADRQGARRIIVFGALTTALSFVVLIGWPTIPGAFVSRLIAGAGGAAVMTGVTILSMDLAPADRRSQAASFMLISFHTGMGTGPMLFEWLQDETSYYGVFWAVAGLSLAAGAIAMMLDHRPGDPHAAPTPLIHRAAIGPGVVALLGVFAFNGFLMFVPLYAREIDVDDVGLMFLISSSTIVIIRVLFGRVPDIIGPIRAGSIALVLTVVAALVIAVWATPVGLAVGAAIVASGLSLQSPSFMKMAADGAPDHERGSVMATFSGSYDVANALVGPTLGITISLVGYKSAFLLTGACAAAGLVLLWFVVGPAWQRRVAELAV